MKLTERYGASLDGGATWVEFDSMDELFKFMRQHPDEFPMSSKTKKQER